MPKIEIDGVTYEVSDGRNVLEAALDHRLDLPYFCYHPGMGSVGACRLCAVKQYRDEDDTQGRVVMSCMTPAKEGTRVSIQDPEATDFRRAVVEWLMTNHPHDCPVCDEGGECHLQDMTVMTGHCERRYRGSKRTFVNQYLGPFIHHEMNRCIQCYRCTRFYNEYAGGEDFGVFGSRNRAYFGRYEEGTLELPFSGNLVEVCPTGVFTDKTYRRHYARKWDLESAPSICGQCGLGCNTIPAATNGTLRRVSARFNGAVNGYWLCDRGRFGYEHVAGPDRLRTPMRRGEAMHHEGAMVDAVAEALVAVSSASRAGSLAGVGSPAAPLETNWMLRRLVGQQRFCAGLATTESDLVGKVLSAARAGRIRLASLQDVHDADVVFVLGSDPTNEAPLLDLEIVRAQRAGASIHVASVASGRLDGFATTGLRLDPPALAELADAVATGLSGKTVAGPAAAIVADLATAKRPVIVTGARIRHAAVVQGALHIAELLSGPDGAPADFVLAVGEADTIGATLMDDGSGLSIEELLESIENGEIDTLLVCENDLYARSEDARRVEDALRRLRALVVFDSRVTRTGEAASSLVPVSTVQESNGTFVNHEARAQRYFQVLPPPPGVVTTWKVLRDLAVEGQVDPRAAGLRSVEDVLADLGRSNTTFAGADEIAPPPGFRVAGKKIARASSRQAGRNARPSIVDVRTFPKPADDPDTPFTFSMEGYDGPPPAALLPRYQLPGWNSTEAINQFQIEVGGPLHGGDPGQRLVEPSGGTESTDSSDGMPRPEHGGGDNGDTPPDGERLVPLKDDIWLCAADEVFGTEPTSRLSPAIAERVPAPYLRLEPGTGARLGLVDARPFDFSFHLGRGVRRARLIVRFDEGVAPGVALIPAGYPESLWLQNSVPVHVEVEPVTEEAP